jgi:hypothetical protein
MATGLGTLFKFREFLGRPSYVKMFVSKFTNLKLDSDWIDTRSELVCYIEQIVNTAVTLKTTLFFYQNPAIRTVVTLLSNHTWQTLTLTRVWIAPEPERVVSVTSTSCKNKNQNTLQ